MHANYRIDIAVASQPTEVTCRRVWAIDRPAQRINLHAATAVYHRHVQPQTTKGEVNELLARRSLDAALASLGQLILRRLLVTDEGAK